MNTTRERLKRILAAAPKDADAGDILGQMADRLLGAGATLPEPAPLKVWPVLEGDGLKLDRKVFDTAYDNAVLAGMGGDDAFRLARTALVAHLFRALVASLPGNPESVHLVGPNERPCPVLRSSLASLADPYDGGVT